MAVLARGPDLLTGAPSKAATLLLEYPAAPYTAFLMSETGCVQCFQQHCTRLVKGLHELSSTDDIIHETSKMTWRIVTLPDIVDKAVPAIQAAASACRARQQVAAPLMLTVVLDNRTGKQDNWLLAHAATLPEQETSKPVEVVCAAPPRVLPSVKHTQWIHARQQYVKHLPDATTEGLICSSDGLLLESFISNLFIVEQRGSSLVVKTAMCNVLPGIKQQQVLDACRALGIQVEHTGAQQSDRHLWVEAFLSNAVKGLRPINKIACLPNNPFGWDPWEVSLAVAPDNSIYTRLQEQLDRDVKNVTTFVLDDAS